MKHAHDSHPRTWPHLLQWQLTPVPTILDGDNPPSPIPDDDNEGGHTQPSLVPSMVSNGDMVTLHFVFLPLNDEFMVFYS